MLYRVLAENRGLYKVTLNKIMSTPLITIDQQSSASDAISLMRSKHIRRLVVTKDDTSSSPSSDRKHVIGMVSLVSITGNIPSNNVDLAELEVPPDIIQKENIKIVCHIVNRGFKVMQRCQNI